MLQPGGGQRDPGRVDQVWTQSRNQEVRDAPEHHLVHGAMDTRVRTHHGCLQAEAESGPGLLPKPHQTHVRKSGLIDTAAVSCCYTLGLLSGSIIVTPKLNSYQVY